MKKNPLIGKGLAVGIILLFVGTCIIPAIAQDAEKPLPTSRGSWLYVGGSGPGNYSKIQDAVDNATDNDTVFIYDDSSPYYESVVINKVSISLIGEDKNTTVIDGSKTMGSVVRIYVDNVKIAGLMMINGWAGFT
jgi:pectin methylesterase-like acyl-CoA thioesterase